MPSSKEPNPSAIAAELSARFEAWLLSHSWFDPGQARLMCALGKVLKTIAGKMECVEPTQFDKPLFADMGGRTTAEAAFGSATRLLAYLDDLNRVVFQSGEPRRDPLRFGPVFPDDVIDILNDRLVDSGRDVEFQ